MEEPLTGTLLGEKSPDRAAHGNGGAAPIGQLEHTGMLLLLICLSVANTVLCTVNLYYYTDTYAQFFNQETGVVYIFVSIPIVLHRSRRRRQLKAAQTHAGNGSLQGGATTDEGLLQVKPPPPLWVLVCIGCLNGTGNFFAAVGAPHTRAETQSLLQLAGIPVVLGLSWLLLGKRPSGVAVLGAALILMGTAVSALPAIEPAWFPAPPPPRCPEAAAAGSSGGTTGGGGVVRFVQEWCECYVLTHLFDLWLVSSCYAVTAVLCGTVTVQTQC